MHLLKEGRLSYSLQHDDGSNGKKWINVSKDISQDVDGTCHVTMEGLTPGKEYLFRVGVSSPYGKGKTSAVGGGATTGVPSQLKKPSVAQVTPTTVKLKWTMEKTASSYVLQMTSSLPSPSSKWISMPTNYCEHSVKDLKANSNNWFRVFGVNEQGEGLPSKVIVVRTKEGKKLTLLSNRCSQPPIPSCLRDIHS